MPADPRLDALASASPNPYAQLQQQITDLRKRLDALERNGVLVGVQDAFPSDAGPEGRLRIDTGDYAQPTLLIYALGGWHTAT